MNDRIIHMSPGSVYIERVETQNVFPGLQRVENKFADNHDATTPAAERAEEVTEAEMAADGEEPRRAATPGRPKTDIFNGHVDVEELAKAVRKIHDTHYNPASRRIEIGDDSFDETDFLLCLYYVLVKRGDSPSTLANKPYYAFLTEACGIHPQASAKTFGNHLNKVVRTGKDFHRLTPGMLTGRQQPGTMTAGELPHWQRMFEAAERVMEIICPKSAKKEDKALSLHVEPS